MKGMSIGLKEALRMTLESIKPLPAEDVALARSVDRVAASDLYALVDSPSIDASLKEGYAVISGEVAHATAAHPVTLRLLGDLAAGGDVDIHIDAGTTVRLLTGARIPTGADAVVSEEFVKREGDDVLVETFAEPGRNILPRGRDVGFGKCVLRSGRQISPGMVGLLAAAGHSTVSVYRKPVVAIIGCGDELVEPGKSLGEGRLYASNIMTLAGWCDRYRMKTRTAVVRDDRDAIIAALEALSDETDVVITSGGAWTGDRDLVARVFEGLGWVEVFHRIRIGPGKPVGFGMLEGKPAFILSGGPSSNMMGFLQIVLPGLLALSGHADPGLPTASARLASELKGRDPDWTDFFFGTLEFGDGVPTFQPARQASRLAAIAEATAIASIPEGRDRIAEGGIVNVQLLR